MLKAFVLVGLLSTPSGPEAKHKLKQFASSPLILFI